MAQTTKLGKSGQTGLFPMLLFFLLAACSYQEKPVSFIVSNPLDLQRINEGVVVSWEQLPERLRKGPVILKDRSGREIPVQSDDLDGDGRPDELYFQLSLAPLESASLQLFSGKTKKTKPSQLQAFVDRGIIRLETPLCTLSSSGPEEIKIYRPSGKDPVIAAAFVIPEPVLRDTQTRILSQGTLRIIAEQKALWRRGSDVYHFQSRFSVALHDPLVRFSIQKLRWPEGAEAAPLSFEVQETGEGTKIFSTRWLPVSKGGGNGAWLFKASQLLEPKPINPEQGRLRQYFTTGGTNLILAWMTGNTAVSVPSPELDRQSERAQQRWLNPMEIFVAN
jgi:Domain of unknown function (DUF4861)